MAGLEDVLAGAFAGGKPGPSAEQDEPSPIAQPHLPRDGSDILFQALGPRVKTRAERARRRKKNGR